MNYDQRVKIGKKVKECGILLGGLLTIVVYLAFFIAIIDCLVFCYGPAKAVMAIGYGTFAICSIVAICKMSKNWERGLSWRGEE